MSIKTKGHYLTSVFRLNMLAGLIVVVVSIYMLITNHYDNIQHRIATESVLNRVSLGGFLYLVVFWYICYFSKPFLNKPKHCS